MANRWILTPLLALAALSANAQQTPQLMVLGSVHLGNNNRDVANTHVEDVLAPKRQAEIEHLVDQLAAYHPTRIAIEWPHAKQDKLDERYAAYRAGTYKLAPDERDQIALRLAKKLGLSKVYAVDWNDNNPGTDADYDWMAWAKAHGKSETLDATVKSWKAVAEKDASWMQSHTVTEWYLHFNEASSLHDNAKTYYDLPYYGDDTNNPGAAWVGQWYARNLRIFTHIREVSKPGDRVLLVIGAGHAPFLRYDATASDAFTLVEPSQYLKPVQ